jgi:hypothetical protein
MGIIFKKLIMHGVRFGNNNSTKDLIINPKVIMISATETDSNIILFCANL